MRASDARAARAEASFRWDVRWLRARVLLVEYVGHMPEDEAHVRSTEEIVTSAPAPIALCYDLARFSSFHRSQVMTHARALTRLAPRIAGIALVGARPSSRFAAVTVSLVSRIPLTIFDERAEAVAWLESLVV